MTAGSAPPSQQHPQQQPQQFVPTYAPQQHAPHQPIYVVHQQAPPPPQQPQAQQEQRGGGDALGAAAMGAVGGMVVGSMMARRRQPVAVIPVAVSRCSPMTAQAGPCEHACAQILVQSLPCLKCGMPVGDWIVSA